jgi:hypothetical protein
MIGFLELMKVLGFLFLLLLASLTWVFTWPGPSDWLRREYLFKKAGFKKWREARKLARAAARKRHLPHGSYGERPGREYHAFGLPPKPRCEHCGGEYPLGRPPQGLR